MADAEQVAELRRMISEPDQTPYSDDELKKRIDDASNDLDTVAADIWQEKASTYSEMVDISEAGSSRKNSQLFTNALKMASFYREASTSADPVPGRDIPTTTPIVRPTA